MSQTLHYRDYRGSVAFSSEDRILHGRLLGIRDMVTFEGQDVDSLEHNFQAAVDEYLGFCAAEGVPPNTPYEGTLKVRVGSELHRQAKLYAEEHHTKLNVVVKEALKAYLAHAE